MGYFQIIIEKQLQLATGLEHWSNSYTVEVDGGIESDPLRNVLYWLTLSEQHLHLQGVILNRCVVRELPYSSPTDSGFRVFGVFGRDLATRPVPANAAPLPLSWALHFNKQTTTGRSGHQAYRGVLHTCDLVQSEMKRLVLRNDSDLCSGRLLAFRYWMLDLESAFVVPGPNENLAIVKPQRRVNGFSVGGVQNQHGRQTRRTYTKLKCLGFQNLVLGYRQLGCDALKALSEIPTTIAGEYNVSTVRHVRGDIFALIEAGRDTIEQIGILNEPPNTLDEKEKCKFSDRALAATGVLTTLVTFKEAWQDPLGNPGLFLGGEEDNQPKSLLSDVVYQAAKVVSVWDWYCHRLGFDKVETLLKPDTRDLMIANLARGTGWFACDPKTQEYLDSLKELPTPQFLISQFKGLLLAAGRKKLTQLLDLAEQADYTNEEETILKTMPEITQTEAESLSADPALAATMLELHNAFVEANKPHYMP
jgi:hypothetical protein